MEAREPGMGNGGKCYGLILPHYFKPNER